MAQKTDRSTRPAAKTPAKTPAKSAAKPAPKLIVDNRKARFRYEVLETMEAGLVLVGTEVKTLREGKAHLDESYARVDDGEIFLVGAHIEEYSHGNRQNHLPTRKRKLLLRESQIKKLAARMAQKGLALVPLKLYFGDRGLAKVELGLCRGKKTQDKRDASRQKDAKREMREGR
ncbi:MAG: SsrA-binding protein SmpB [Planctomycetes bacterium]|nr:SsrA-binding protein SmpB [Planctomycetota bacterium]